MTQALRGMRDIFGTEIPLWHAAESVFRHISASYGYQEIRTPLLESTELFQRGIGEGTDIVGKEMYTFTDRGGDSVTLRPEMTAPVVRTAIEHNLLRHNPTTRLWYCGPLFRYERPQKGRFRQFHQYGAECLGSAHGSADAEIISLANRVIAECGIQSYTLEINSLGNKTSRQVFRTALVEYLEGHRSALSEESEKRLGTNPLRILDSKADTDALIIAGAPTLGDYLDAESADRFLELQSMLNELGISYTLNPRLVRGLDYYNHVVFEFTTTLLGSQNAIAGGGRYDPLFTLIGGKETAATGFSIGIERLIMMMELDGAIADASKPPDVCVINAGATPSYILRIADSIRRAGFSATTDVQHRSLQAQMREAGRNMTPVAVIIGPDEVRKETMVIKEMTTGEQKTVNSSMLVETISQILQQH